jgi:dihydropteroate synthase
VYIRISCDEVRSELEHMKVHPAGVDIMAPKALLEPLRLFHVKAPAANIIKQEMLALGAECATEAGAINCSQPYVDLLLIGTRLQYRQLVEKLGSMTAWFSISSVIADLNEFLQAEQPVTKLADGRILTYEKMRVMGILNVTPDSFYPGSRVMKSSDLLKRAEQMISDGADVLDIGGESTRPGASPVSSGEESHRVTSAISEIRKAFPKVILSVDTYHAATAEAALDAGADIINDITAAEGDARMLPLAVRCQVPLILMHMRGTPRTMQSPELVKYDHVSADVARYLLERAEVCKQAGLKKELMILDPGLGFAKDEAGNLELCRNLSVLTGHGIPVLLAGSRKTFIGKVLGNLPVEERLEGTMALSAAAVYAGAQMVRVHDVKENVRLIRMLEAIWQCR